jgi:hypothetical protein
MTSFAMRCDRARAIRSRRSTASYAQYVAQNYEEAMRLSGAAIRMRRDFASAHRVHVAAAAMAGRADVASAALRELRRAQPNI